MKMMNFQVRIRKFFCRFYWNDFDFLGNLTYCGLKNMKLYFLFLIILISFKFDFF